MGVVRKSYQTTQIVGETHTVIVGFVVVSSLVLLVLPKETRYTACKNV